MFGCTTVTTRYYTGQRYAPTGHIDVYRVRRPDKPYVEIAELIEGSFCSLSDIINKARSIGADGIILLERETKKIHIFGSDGELKEYEKKKMRAIAIKYKK